MTQALALETLDWQAQGLAAIERAAKHGAPFDAYTLSLNGLPDPSSPAQWGALFRQAAGRGLIVLYGYHPSDRPKRSKGLCRLWRGAGHGPTT